MPEKWDQVKELFTLALERGPEERSDFLRQACVATSRCGAKSTRCCRASMAPPLFWRIVPPLICCPLSRVQ